MPVITGINHVTLAVRDPARSFVFYSEVLGMRPVARWPEGAYLLAGRLWVCLVADAATRTGPLPEYTHVAFSVPPEDFEAIRKRLLGAGTPQWQDNRTEGESLYFLDPDGHKLEIHATDLASRLRHAEQHPWEGLEILVDPETVARLCGPIPELPE